MKKFFLILIIVASGFLFFTKLVLAEDANMKIGVEIKKNEIQEEKIPRIDDEAASIVKNDKGEVLEENLKETINEERQNRYSTDFWIFLFGAYLFLFIFNLSFDFAKTKEAHWFWEFFYTFLAVFVWDQLDFERKNSWFPGVVMESAIVIYAFYFYFLRKRLKLDFEKKLK